MIVSIIGASGFIGRHLIDYLKISCGSLDYKIVGTYFSTKKDGCEFLDVRNEKSIMRYLDKIKPDYILLLAGTKDVKKCEQSWEYAYTINTKPIENFCGAIKILGLETRMIFFSSDYVFDGTRGNYSEVDLPNPITNYGKSKFFAEKILMDSQIEFKIIRTAAVMGKGALFFDWLLDNLIWGQKIYLYSNVYFSPTPINFLCYIIKKILTDYEKIGNKIIHLVGEKRMSRYEFGILVRNLMNLENKLVIIPQVANFDATYFQKDLSMTQSDFVKKNQIMALQDYMLQIIRGDWCV